MTSSDSRNLVDGFVRSAAADPEALGLAVGGARFTYGDLSARAEAIGRILDERRGESQLVGLLAARSVTAYTSILGALSRCLGYVPLNPAFPAARNAKMLNSSTPDIVLVGSECFDELAEILPMVEQATRFVILEVGEEGVPDFDAGPHTIEVLPVDASAGEALTPIDTPPDTIAYILFTSGSTGEPKGVVVSHANALAYFDHIAESFDFGPDDRFSQNFDLTFDLSVHDIFTGFGAGASLHCPTKAETKLPSRFIKEHELTVWFCVPSVASVMARLRMARPDMYPTLRMSLFCGEGLPLSTARTWQAAAPNSQLVNLYGPTEGTIAMTRFDIPADLPEERCHGGIVPIGTCFPTQTLAVVDGEGQRLPAGAQGELVLGGTQITLGYWRNEEKTNQQFVEFPHLGEGRWYRTGDLVYEDDEGILQFIGRIDHQVKIMGYRVELQEIEHQLRQLSGYDSVAAVAWPVEGSTAQGIEAFVAGGGDGGPDAEEIIERAREKLPVYMVPKRVHFVDEFPVNSNGKLDRRALAQTYLDGAS